MDGSTTVLAGITNEQGKEKYVTITKPFPPDLSKTAPTKKDGEKKEVVNRQTRESPFTSTLWGGLQEECLQALQEMRKICLKKGGNTPGVHADTKFCGPKE